MPYDPWYRPARQRARSGWLRWYLLFGLALTLPIPIAETLVHHAGDRTLPPNAFIILLPLMLGMMRSPFARAPWLTAWGRAQFDEFELDALHRATIAAYATMLAIVIAGFFWLWLGTLLSWPIPDTPRAWSAWGSAMVGVGMSLPAIYAEWMVPLPPVEPLEDDGELM